MFNPGDIMGKIQEMQSKIRDAQAKMDSVVVESEAGGGMVRVRANANRKVLKIEIDPTIVDKNDTEFMSDLIAAAVNKALEQAETRGKEEMQKATEGIMPNIPGLNLGGLGG
jgi:DNA-binding YbaB/EbfC family protein